MNPIVLIAMYGRKPLIQINLELLHKQNCKVVVITSSDSDYHFVRDLDFDNVRICTAPNQPLGKKWQIGVDFCRAANADPLIILGSDDFLSSAFISKACELKEDFTFFTEWFIHDLISKKDYKLRYKKVFPLGSGRVFSKSFLDRNNWKIFDDTRSRLLDDFAFDNIKFADKIKINPEGMRLLAVKGRWETMNELDKILLAPSIHWDPETKISDQIGYDVHKIFQGI